MMKKKNFRMSRILSTFFWVFLVAANLYSLGVNRMSEIRWVDHLQGTFWKSTEGRLFFAVQRTSPVFAPVSWLHMPSLLSGSLTAVLPSVCALNILFFLICGKHTPVLSQWFSNISVHQNHSDSDSLNRRWAGLHSWSF